MPYDRTEYGKQRRAKAKQLGLCVVCQKIPALPTLVVCELCQKRRNELRSKHRENAKIKNLCVICEERPAGKDET